MRTLALATAVAAACLGAPTADAICTSGVDCIRERFGPDLMLRQNRIYDRTDRIGTRQPINPYVARELRRPGRAGAGTDGVTSGLYPEYALPEAGEAQPDPRYAPGGALGAPTILVPTQPRPEPDGEPALTVEPYLPAQPAPATPSEQAGGATAPGPRAAPSRDPYAALRPAPAVRVPPDPNRPAGGTDLRYTGPRSSGAYR